MARSKKLPPPTAPTPPATNIPGGVTPHVRPGAWEAFVTDLVFGVSVQEAAIRHGLDPLAVVQAIDGSELERYVARMRATLRRLHRSAAGLYAEVGVHTLTEMATSPGVPDHVRVAAAAKLVDQANHRDDADNEERKIDSEERLEAMAARLDALLGPRGPG